tara:strand:- start:109604 stop:110860 length:1257 start_codon:yes stop_codon:yes gene_type:complete
MERLSDRYLLAGDLTNETNPLDVNGDDLVSASDALAVINYLNRSTLASEGEAAPSVMYMDVNGDEKVTSGDALMVVNGLSRQVVTPLPAETDDSDDGETDTESHNGNVAVKVRGKDVFVDFTGTEDTLVIWSPQPGLLRLEYGYEGVHEVPIGDDLFIDIAGADLSVVLGKVVDVYNDGPIAAEAEDYEGPGGMYYEEIVGAIIPDDLFVDVSGDANLFAMRASYVGDDLIYRGTDGRDYVEIGAGSVINDLASVITKSGDDRVSLGSGDERATAGTDGVPLAGARVGGDFIADLGKGNDWMLFDYAEIGDDAKVIAGDGNDQILHEYLRVRDDYFAYGHDGSDYVRVRNVEVGDDAHLYLGDDNDTAEVSFVRVGDVGEIHGGGDHDILRSDESTIEVKTLKIRKFEEIYPLDSYDE